MLRHHPENAALDDWLDAAREPRDRT